MTSSAFRRDPLDLHTLEESIRTHSPKFLEAVASDADVVIMSALGFAHPSEATYLWECIQYARIKGKKVLLAPGDKP
jgi:hypothetical protein